MSFFYPAKKSLMDVPGNGDCGFLSVATGLIDTFLLHNDDKILKKILTAYAYEYPKDRLLNNLRILKNTERMQLIFNVAYVLRQMAVKEFSTNPYNYTGVFADAHENTSIEAMRKPGTYIDESAIAALAATLDIKIVVKVVAPQKDGFLRLTYNENAKTKITLQLKNRHYRPEVHNPSLFHALKSAKNTLEVKENVHENRPMIEILKDIEAGLVKDRVIYEDIYDTLYMKVANGELDKKGLIKIYIENLRKSDYLSGRIGHVASEYNNQDFFITALKQPNNSAVTSHDEQIILQLLHALSTAHTIKEINLEEQVSPMLSR